MMASDPDLEAADAVLHPAIVTPTTSSRRRPKLIHSNNLHSGSFLDYNSDDDSITEGTRHQDRYHDHSGNTNHYKERVLKLVSDTNEWGKLHNALRQRRRRFCTNASVQQCLNQLLQEQQQSEQLPASEVDEEQEEHRRTTAYIIDGHEIRSYESCLGPPHFPHPTAAGGGRMIATPFHKV